MIRQEKYKGWDVVLAKEPRKKMIDDYHLARVPRNFMPGKSGTKTRCRKLVTCPVMHTAEYAREIKDGKQNCETCFAGL